MKSTEGVSREMIHQTSHKGSREICAFCVPSSRCRGTDAAWFEAVRCGFRSSCKTHSIFGRDVINPVAVLHVKNPEHDVSDKWI